MVRFTVLNLLLQYIISNNEGKHIIQSTCPWNWLTFWSPTGLQLYKETSCLTPGPLRVDVVFFLMEVIRIAEVLCR